MSKQLSTKPRQVQDQASVLVQLGFLDPAGLPVVGAESARKVLNPKLPPLDLERREVVYADSVGGELREGWDHLVLACGLAANLELVPGMAAHAWPLKTPGDAPALRHTG